MDTQQPMGGQTTPLSFGQKAVGITFNPGQNPKVNEVKELYAKIIDLCKEVMASEKPEGMVDTDYRNDLLTTAIKEAQGAQMWAVKGITCQY